MTPSAPAFTAAAHRHAAEAARPVECLSFRAKTHRAAIRLLREADGWTWAADSQRLFGDYAGFGEGLGRPDGSINPRRFAPTSDEAISAAGAEILRHTPDPALVAWLDSLAPEQKDLFE